MDASRPKCERPSAGRWRASLPELIAGVLLAGAIFLPWMSRGGETVMPWGMFARAAWPVGLFLMAAHAIGLAAILVIVMARGVGRSAGHLLLGAVGLALLLAAFGRDSHLSVRRLGPAAVSAAGAAGTLLIGLIVLLGLHCRLGPRRTLRALLAINAACLGLGLTAGVAVTLSAHGRSGSGGDYATFDLVFAAGLQLAVLAGCALALTGALAGGRRLAAAARGIVYIALAALGLYGVLRVAVGVGVPAMVLPFLHITIYCGGITVLFCRGLTGTIASLATGRRVSG